MNKTNTTLLIIFILGFAFNCTVQKRRDNNAEAALREVFIKQTDVLIAELTMLDRLVNQLKPVDKLQLQFSYARFQYKKVEAIIEYYFQGLTKRINGPALPDVKTEDNQVWPPHGFQVIEQYLFSNYADSLVSVVSSEIKILQSDLQYIKTNMDAHAILPIHVKELIQHECIRIAAHGISGFDAPVSKLSLPEAQYALLGMQEVVQTYYDKIADTVKQQFENSISYLKSNNDFDSFNRMEFLNKFLIPLSSTLAKAADWAWPNDTLNYTGAFNGTLVELFSGVGFKADYYSPYAEAASNPNKVALGELLFFDKSLSLSGNTSCGSCHKPALYFTDGKTKAENFVHGGSLLRNTPTLYYAALQSNQFFDMRSVSLEDQVHDVMKSSVEFNLSASGNAQKLINNKTYKQLFQKAFPGSDSITGFQIRNAIAAFVRSLSPFTSAFDKYMKGDKTAMTDEQISGFNLFVGKAKCGSCHFLPVFNGTVPPFYTKSESEIIGVPATAIWKNAKIDADSGRYKINQLQELAFAFKTPTVRNAEKTAPYMHNGVYKTLDDVVEFYHIGGGVGLGISLPFQTLPFDSLQLNNNEKKAIVAFMRSLTDKEKKY